MDIVKDLIAPALAVGSTNEPWSLIELVAAGNTEYAELQRIATDLLRRKPKNSGKSSHHTHFNCVPCGTVACALDTNKGLGTCEAFAHKHALHTKNAFCENWQESMFLTGK